MQDQVLHWVVTNRTYIQQEGYVLSEIAKLLGELFKLFRELFKLSEELTRQLGDLTKQLEAVTLDEPLSLASAISLCHPVSFLVAKASLALTLSRQQGLTLNGEINGGRQGEVHPGHG